MISGFIYDEEPVLARSQIGWSFTEAWRTEISLLCSMRTCGLLNVEMKKEKIT
jgi:hypothetical protein